MKTESQEANEIDKSETEIRKTAICASMAHVLLVAYYVAIFFTVPYDRTVIRPYTIITIMSAIVFPLACLMTFGIYKRFKYFLIPYLVAQSLYLIVSFGFVLVAIALLMVNPIGIPFDVPQETRATKHDMREAVYQIKDLIKTVFSAVAFCVLSLIHGKYLDAIGRHFLDIYRIPGVQIVAPTAEPQAVVEETPKS